MIPIIGSDHYRSLHTVWGLKTLTVVGLYYHLGFFGEQILLTKFVRRYSHLLYVAILYILYSKKRTLSRVPL